MNVRILIFVKDFLLRGKKKEERNEIRKERRKESRREDQK